MSRRSAIALVLALVVGALAPASGHAAAPRLLMVTGPGLSKPVLLTSWTEISEFVQAAANESPATAREALAGRPSLRLALFWDATIWEPYIRERKLASLRPSDATQFGSFYPAANGRSAALDLPWTGQWPKQPNARALAILERHGVPVALGGPEGGGIATGWWLTVAAAGALLVAAAAGLYRRRTRANSVTSFPHGDSP